MTKARWARVLIVEDSPTAARLLVDGISRDPRLAVAGVALTATEAASLADQLHPDVITVDLMLPDETGLDVILRVLRKRYVPIIVVSALPQNGSSLAFRSLLAGAADIVPKPSGSPAAMVEFFEDLNERIALLASATVHLDIRTVALTLAQAQDPTKRCDRWVRGRRSFDWRTYRTRGVFERPRSGLSSAGRRRPTHRRSICRGAGQMAQSRNALVREARDRRGCSRARVAPTSPRLPPTSSSRAVGACR